MEWSEFARRLGRELAGLDPDTILIVRERDESRHYVQAMREPDRLYAEAVSNNFLDGPLLLTLADEEVMSEAGWQPPADPAPRNWWTELPGHAAPADHDRLADVMVTALRDVQGVRRPSDLVHESFHRHGTGLIELLDFGIDAADPARVSSRRHTPGGPPAPAAPAPEPLHAAPVPPPGGDLEARLAAARQRQDQDAYFELLLAADLVLPAVADPGADGLPIITIGGATFVTVFTSQQAMGPGPSYPTSFPLIAGGWPDPAWQLAINPGLPSESHLDIAVVRGLAARRLAAEAAPPAPVPGVPLRPPHGTRMWRDDGDGAEAPVAVYDAIGGAWAQVRAEALPTSRTE
ncbi:SseB family protein [Actinomadura sp. PM05-2]|uniref:SseB family protein n=1 Tax=Actinomadura parmotrematis TaxID=2864039 RepID=A0ABS7FWX2_9ACTN|nr:SseB family protein [Actinomadura parmotrematis]